MTESMPPPGWYPAGQVFRWWDGTQWTPHEQPFTQSAAAQPVPTLARAASGSLFTERSLVFSQEAKIVGHNNYVVLDSRGQNVGIVDGVGESSLSRAASLNLALRDASGESVLTIATVPWKLERFTIEGPGPQSVGEIRSKVFSKTRYGLFSDDREIGGIRSTGRYSFTVECEQGEPVAEITYSRDATGKIIRIAHSFQTTLEIVRPLAQPMASLVLAAGVIVNKYVTRREMHRV